MSEMFKVVSQTEFEKLFVLCKKIAVSITNNVCSLKQLLKIDFNLQTLFLKLNEMGVRVIRSEVVSLSKFTSSEQYRKMFLDICSHLVEFQSALEDNKQQVDYEWIKRFQLLNFFVVNFTLKATEAEKEAQNMQIY